MRTKTATREISLKDSEQAEAFTVTKMKLVELLEASTMASGRRISDTASERCTTSVLANITATGRTEDVTERVFSLMKNPEMFIQAGGALERRMGTVPTFIRNQE